MCTELYNVQTKTVTPLRNQLSGIPTPDSDRSIIFHVENATQYSLVPHVGPFTHGSMADDPRVINPWSVFEFSAQSDGAGITGAVRFDIGDVLYGDNSQQFFLMLGFDNPVDGHNKSFLNFMTDSFQIAIDGVNDDAEGDKSRDGNNNCGPKVNPANPVLGIIGDSVTNFQPWIGHTGSSDTPGVTTNIYFNALLTYKASGSNDDNIKMVLTLSQITTTES